jgi:hypothetical protein
MKSLKCRYDSMLSMFGCMQWSVCTSLEVDLHLDCWLTLSCSVAVSLFTALARQARSMLHISFSRR